MVKMKLDIQTIHLVNNTRRGTFVYEKNKNMIQFVYAKQFQAIRAFR